MADFDPSRWQPIETAVECGNERLVWVPFTGNEAYGYPSIAFIGIGGWTDEDGGIVHPSHWLPIPPNPASAIEARSDATGTGAAEGESAAPQEDAQ